MNLIIIGAKGIETKYNNPLQASQEDLVKIKELHNCNVKCYDGLYDKYAIIDSIEYIPHNFPNNFDVCDTNIFDKNKQNILIEFCNYFDENYINSSLEDNKKQIINNYIKATTSGYKIAIIICGCCWNDTLPIECINNVIKYKLTTPMHPYNIDSYKYIINNNKSLKILEDNKMKCYVEGLYCIMGTLMWRGCKSDNYESEEILREIFTEIRDNNLYDVLFLDDELIKLNSFIDKKINWNFLDRYLRIKITNFIYGNNILIK